MGYFQDNSTQVITQTITLSSSVDVGKNVTLIFQGGKFENSSNSEITLTGENTKIVAPITQIFGSRIKAAGTWVVDRAYPQWFGATTYDSFQDYTDSNLQIDDASVSINRAIAMKQRGEVFLPKGIYVLKMPIIISDGIQLVGEKGMEPYGDNNFQGTILQTWRLNDGIPMGDDSDVQKFYMVFVNYGPLDFYNREETIWGRLTGDGFLAGQITAIKDIEFYNFLPNTHYPSAQLIKQSTTAFFKGLYAAESVMLDHVRFYNLRNALTYKRDIYIDSKKVTYCDYVCNHKIFASLPKLFAFDFGDNGDDLMFDHNSIQDGKYNKGLILRNCAGGTIRGNIMHADIEIHSCKAITFSNNHMEFGPVIQIISSAVSMNDNYIERAYRTPIEIIPFPTNEDFRDKTILSMHNDAIVFKDNAREYYELSEVSGNGNINFNNFLYRLLTASLYDIKIDWNTVLNLDHVFRYRIGRIDGKMYPAGLKICKSDGTSFNEFNDFSYMLSQKGIVSCDYHVDKSFTINNINNIDVHTAMKNIDNVYWLYLTGTYVYKYQVIYDKERRLLATRGNSQLFDVVNDGNLDGGVTQNTFNGILLSINDNNGNSVRATIRLFRKSGTDWETGDDLRYVDIPNTNNHYFYDNGICINGFRWNPATTNDILSGATGIDSITYQGANVVCRFGADGNSNNSIWKAGDILIKTGANPSIEVK
ncbi:MAG: hypothetical protein IJT30_07555 [Muribaculaceae bacterium]|nr:hypothetical protein [Muribaculaceae bacterium]